MKKALAFGFSFLLISPPAIAQEYEPIQLGTFLLGPSLEISQEYNDNVLASESDEESDFITSIKPELTIQKSIRDHEFEFKAGAQIDRYADKTEEDIENYSTSLTGRLIARRAWQIPFGLSYDIDHRNRVEERTTTSPSEPVEFSKARAEIGLEYLPRGKFFASLNLLHERERFENATDGNGNLLVREDEDSDDTRLTARVSYEEMPALKPFLQATYGQEDFVRNSFNSGTFSGRNGDNSYQNYLLGAVFDYRELITGELAAGLTHQDNDEPGEGDIDTLAVQARLNWQPTRSLNISSVFLRDIEEDPSVNSRIVQTDFTLDGVYAVNEKLSFNLGGAYGHDKFEDSTRRDDFYQLSAGFDYAIFKRFDVGLLLRHSERDSNFAGQSFDQNSVIFRVKGKL